jgi:hypothetical protein
LRRDRLSRRLGLALAVSGLAACDSAPAPAVDAFVSPSGLVGRPDATALPSLPPGVAVFADATRPVDAAAEAGTEPEPAPDQACFAGGATGIACTPDGSAIAEAHVVAQTHDCHGNPVAVETVSGSDGRFVLRGLAPGPTRIVVQSGRFLAEATVEVPESGTVFAGGGNGKVCFTSDATRIAVLGGTFDHAERILTAMGFDHDRFCGDLGDALPARRLLQDWDRLKKYDVLVVNCGSGVSLRSDDPYTEQTLDNLRRFVREGGSMYVSDLSADFVGRVWPGVVDFAPTRTVPLATGTDACCVCGVDCPERCLLPDDPTACGTTGDAPASCRELSRGLPGGGKSGLVTANLEAAFLQRTFEAEQVQIRFDLSGWMEIDRIESGVELLVSGVSPGQDTVRPMMLIFRPEPGGGQVAYTSFHTSAQAGETIDALIRALLLRL